MNDLLVVRYILGCPRGARPALFRREVTARLNVAGFNLTSYATIVIHSPGPILGAGQPHLKCCNLVSDRPDRGALSIVKGFHQRVFFLSNLVLQIRHPENSHMCWVSPSREIFLLLNSVLVLMKQRRPQMSRIWS